MVNDQQIKPNDAYKDIGKLFFQAAAIVGEILPHCVLGLVLAEHLLSVPGLQAVAAGVADTEGGLLVPGIHRTDVSDQDSDSTEGSLTPGPGIIHNNSHLVPLASQQVFEHNESCPSRGLVGRGRKRLGKTLGHLLCIRPAKIKPN